MNRRDTFKFQLLWPRGSRREEENALPSTSHAYSTESIFPYAISRQNSSSKNVSGRLHVLKYLLEYSLFAIFSKSRKVYFLEFVCSYYKLLPSHI